MKEKISKLLSLAKQRCQKLRTYKFLHFYCYNKSFFTINRLSIFRKIILCYLSGMILLQHRTRNPVSCLILKLHSY